MQYWLGKDKKRKIQQTKMKVTSQNWILPDIAGLMVGGSPRITTVYFVKKVLASGIILNKKIWEDMRTESIGVTCGG